MNDPYRLVCEGRRLPMLGANIPMPVCCIHSLMKTDTGIDMGDQLYIKRGVCLFPDDFMQIVFLTV